MTTNRRTLWVLSWIAALALALSACGGADGNADEGGDSDDDKQASATGSEPGNILEFGEQYKVEFTAGETELEFEIEPDPGVIISAEFENDAASSAFFSAQLTQDGEAKAFSDTASPGGSTDLAFTLAAEDDDSTFKLELSGNPDTTVTFQVNTEPQEDGGKEGDAPGELANPRPLDLGGDDSDDDDADEDAEDDEADSDEDADSEGDESDDADEDGDAAEDDEDSDTAEGMELPGHLGGNDQADYYSFDAAGGDEINIPLTNHDDSEGSISVTLMFNGDSIETANVNAGGDDAITRTLGDDEDGEYILVVTGFGETNYTFTPSLGSQADCGQEGDAPSGDGDNRAIDVPSDCDGRFGDADVDDSYEFEAAGGDLIEIEVSNDATSDGRVFLSLRFNGKRLDNVTVNAGGTETISRTLAAADGGTYEILVEGDSGQATTYNFTLGGGTQDDGGSGGDAGEEGDELAIEVGKPISGVIGDSDKVDAYKVNITSPNATIEFTNDAASDGRVLPKMFVNGKRKGDANVSPGGSEVVEMTEVTGELQIVVKGDSVPAVNYTFTVTEG